jgi:hypothetical protein
MEGDGNGGDLHARVGSRTAPNNGDDDGAGVGNFFGAKVVGGSFGPGAVNSVDPLDPLGMETPVRDDLAPLGGPSTYIGGQEGPTDKALLCPTTPTTGLDRSLSGGRDVGGTVLGALVQGGDVGFATLRQDLTRARAPLWRGAF